MNYFDPNDYWMQDIPDPYKGMSDNEWLMAGCLQGAAFIVMLAVGLLLCALLIGCTTTRTVEVERIKTDTAYITKTARDSIYVRDSTIIRSQGDTVVFHHWHTEWRDRWHHDSIYIAKTDTVPRPYPVEVVKEVPAELSWWQQARMFVGGIVIFLLIILAGWRIFVLLHPRV